MLMRISAMEIFCLYCDAARTNRHPLELLFGDNGLRGTPGAVAFMRVPRRVAAA
jgi:hypothetical protein